MQEINLFSEVGLNHYLILSAVLFTIGMSGVLLRRNLIVILMSVELVTSSTVANGGPTCKSVRLVGLLPAPVKSNKFKKNRYHSRDNNPVLGSVNGVRGAGMVVTLSGLGTGWTQ